MAGTCEGNWLKSKIKGADDGTIEVKESTGGVLTGKHKKTNRDLVGQCTEGVVSHITFVRTGADGCFYIYDGDIEEVTIPVEKLQIKNGTVTRMCAQEKTKRAPLDSDDWTAEKPT
jgi:hypothetical protein